MTRKKSVIVVVLLVYSIVIACSIPTLTPESTTPVIAITSNPESLAVASPTVSPSPITTPNAQPNGKIAFTCQLFKVSYQDQICIINADGTGFLRLTTDDTSEHFYPSFAPDGNSVVYSANPTGLYEIYETDLNGNTRQLTYGLGTLTSPEISPDGKLIAFSLGDGITSSLWLMDRDGANPRMLYGSGWDPTWSPGGEMILFASYDPNSSIQLFTINLDGTDLKQITRMANLRGRSDWSPDGDWIVTYAGEPWGRELYLIPAAGGDPRQLTPSGGNSQGPSFSLDGNWVAFTAYFNDIGNDDGCEIYLIRTDGSELTRLTENDYCDWQPRWGP